VKNLLNAARTEQWPAGRTLFREGDPVQSVYIVVAGEIVRVFNARRGVHKTLRGSHAGEIVGLSDAVSGAVHDCTATTRTPCTIGTLPANELWRLLEDAPSLWLTVLQFLSNDVNACYDSMRSVAGLR
jgi:CRP-like cAMP-binding protein